MDTRFSKIRKQLSKYQRFKYSFILLIPGIVLYIVFYYIPMYGVLIAFKDYSPFLGFFKSPWVGFKYFEGFINGPYFFRLLRNTVMINVFSLIFSFPAPIILALLLNELKSEKYKKIVQTVTYLPNFISEVIIVGLLVTFLSPSTGIINHLLTSLFGIEPIPFMIEANWFYTIFIASGIWQGAGFGTIIFLAAIAGVDISLYEAVSIDGGGRWKKFLYVTLPCIVPTIIFMLIFRIAGMLNVDSGKIILMYNPLTYETADVFSTYVYRAGLQGSNFGLGTAVGLMNSIVSLLLLIGANKVSKKISDTSLW